MKSEGRKPFIDIKPVPFKTVYGKLCNYNICRFCIHVYLTMHNTDDDNKPILKCFGTRREHSVMEQSSPFYMKKFKLRIK